MADPVIGQVYGGRYFIEGRLGTGAMGAVYRARHTKLAARAFAVKVLHRQLANQLKQRRRFEREAELASSLHHPNVIGVVDVGEAPDGTLYLVMELADGVQLASMLGKPFPPARVLAYARQLCAGLEHAHAMGLIHRDFKPENVIVERGATPLEDRLRIVDFGIAMWREAPAGDDRLTTAGVVIGTPHYMAPEHASGQEVDHRIDLFALGVLCFEMITGVMPFDGDGVEVARANINSDAPPMSERAPHVEIDPLLEAITRKLMARDRDRRPASAAAAAELFALIERDRTAAAAALGVVLEPVAATTPILPVIAPRQIVAMAPLEQVRSVTTSTAVIVSRSGTARRELARDRRGWFVGAALVAAVFALAFVVSSGDRDGDVQRTPAPPVVHEPVAVAPAPPSIPNPIVTPIDAAPQRAITAPSPRRPLPPAVLPAPIIAPAEPTAASVAEHYAAVGRALTRLQETHGKPAVFDLWPRFRYIRIQQAIATADERLQATQILVAIEREIERRTGP